MTCAECGKCTISRYGWPATFERFHISTRFRAHTTVISEGQRLSGILIDCSGATKITITTSAGKSIVLKLCQSGEVIGLPDLLASETSSITCTTMFDCELRFVPWLDLQKSVLRDASALRTVLSQLAGNVRDEREKLRMLVSPSVRQRIINFLRSLLPSGLADFDRSVLVPFPYTHEQIAELVGCTRESVTRVLSGRDRRILNEETPLLVCLLKIFFEKKLRVQRTHISSSRDPTADAQSS